MKRSYPIVALFVMVLVLSFLLDSRADEGALGVNIHKVSYYVAYDTPLTEVYFNVSGLDNWGDGLGVANLVEELKRTKPEFRIQSAYLLGKLGEKAKDATVALVHALKDKDFMVRTNAAWALEQIGVESKAVISGLIFALKDEQEHVRLNAAAALYKLGSAENNAIPSLRKLLKDKNEVVRMNAQITLERIENKSKSTTK